MIAAIIGPIIAGSLRSVAGYADFALCYAALIGLGLLTLLIMAKWHPEQAKPVVSSESFSPPISVIRDWNIGIIAAIFASAGGYLIMNLLMVQASLVMKNICSFDASSRAIQIHVLSMFAPSFITGSFIAIHGLRRTLLFGFTLLISAAGVGMMQISYESIFVCLLLLGLGWNLTYVGGGVLLTDCVSDNERHRWQGINDTFIAGCATLGAFLPAPLFTSIGWNNTNSLSLLLCFTGLIVCWGAVSSQQGKTVKKTSER